MANGSVIAAIDFASLGDSLFLTCHIYHYSCSCSSSTSLGAQLTKMMDDRANKIN
jgi:hypothetical protein